MLKIIVKQACMNPEGSNVANKFHTFDIECEALEKMLSTPPCYNEYSVVGAEVKQTGTQDANKR